MAARFQAAGTPELAGIRAGGARPKPAAAKQERRAAALLPPAARRGRRAPSRRPSARRAPRRGGFCGPPSRGAPAGSGRKRVPGGRSTCDRPGGASSGTPGVARRRAPFPRGCGRRSSPPCGRETLRDGLWRPLSGGRSAAPSGRPASAQPRGEGSAAPPLRTPARPTAGRPASQRAWRRRPRVGLAPDRRFVGR